MRFRALWIGIVVLALAGPSAAQPPAEVSSFEDELGQAVASGNAERVDTLLDQTIQRASASKAALLEAAAHLAKAKWLRDTGRPLAEAELRASIALLKAHPDPDLQRRLQLAEVRSLDEGGQRLQATTIGLALVSEVRDAGDWRLEIQALLELAQLGHNWIRSAETSQYALQAHQVAERHRGSPEAFEADLEWADREAKAHHTDAAVAVLQRSVEDAKAARNARAQDLALMAMGIAYEQAHEWSHAVASTHEAIDLATTLQFSPHFVAVLFVNLSDVLINMGEYRGAMDAADKAIARAVEWPAALSAARFNRAIAANHLGRHDDALATLEQLSQGADREESLYELSQEYAVANRFRTAYQYLVEYEAWRNNHTASDKAQELALVDLNDRLAGERQLRIDGEKQLTERTVAAAVLVFGLLMGIGAWSLRTTRSHNRALRSMNDQLHRQATTDALTGLRNRRHFGAEIASHIAEADRAVEERRTTTQSLDLVFFLIDLDHFKQVNDLHGHPAGDAVLVEAAQRLQSLVRADDELIRWGGEEFLLVTRGTSRERAGDVAERVRRSIESAPFALQDGTLLSRTCSVGFAPYPLIPGDARSFGWASVVELADQALLLAKTSGRDRWIGVVRAKRLPHLHVGALVAAVRAGDLQSEASGDVPPLARQAGHSTVHADGIE